MALATALATTVLAALAAPVGRAAAATCTPPKQLGIVFVLDASGSMSSNDPDKLRVEATKVGIDRVPDGSVVAVSTFSDAGAGVVAPTVVDAKSRGSLKAAADAAGQIQGGTVYDAAFGEAKRQLDLMTTADRKVVVFLSDGEPNDANYSADDAIAGAGIPIYAVGFGDAPALELQGIAARSRAEAFALKSPGDTQAVFARIVSQLVCDKSQTQGTTTIPAGQTRTFGFDVPADATELRALAAWDTGEVTVTLGRSDGTTLQRGKLRRGETLNAQATFAEAKAIDPRAGRWELRLRAGTKAATGIRTSFNVFTRTAPGLTPVPTGACQTRVVVAAADVRGDCLERVGGGFVSAKPISVNGLVLHRLGPGRFRINPNSYEITSDGPFVAGQGALFIAGGLSLKWDVRKSTTFNTKGSREEIGMPSGDAADDSGVSIGKLDFSGGKLAIGPLEITGTPDLTVEKDDNLGNVTKAKLQVELPKEFSGGITGTATVLFRHGAGPALDGAGFTVGEGVVRGLPLKDIKIEFEGVAGSNSLFPPTVTAEAATDGAQPPYLVGLAVRIGITDGRLTKVGADVTDINRPLPNTPLFLQKIGFDLLTSPPAYFGVNVGLTVGPEVKGKAVTGLDATGKILFDPFGLELEGKLTVVDFEIASANAKYQSGRVDITGQIDASREFFGTRVGWSAGGRGVATSSVFLLEGNGDLQLGPVGARGDVLLSNLGYAACASFKILFKRVVVGLGAEWGDRPDIGGSCNLEAFRPAGAELARLAAGPITAAVPIRVPKGRRTLAIGAIGTTAPPVFTLTDPQGRATTIDPAAPGVVPIAGDPRPAAFVQTIVARRGTYVVLAAPSAGRWTVRAAPGPSTVDRFETAGGLAPARVSAIVSGPRAQRRLSYRIAVRRGQQVRFVERTARGQQPLFITRKARGTVRFTPADDGSRGTRQIVAFVLQNGLLRTTKVVARFASPAVVRPARVTGLRLRRRGTSVLATWRPAARAARYRVRVAVSDGRRVLYFRTARRRGVAVKAVQPGERVTVKVFGYSAAGRPGRPATRSIRRPAPTPRRP